MVKLTLPTLVGIGQKYIVYEITSKYGAIRWPTSYNTMCGRQKDMLVFMGMGYKGVDCSLTDYESIYRVA